MTDEMKKLLEVAYNEEVQDHQKYLKMADNAKEHECYEMSGVLRDIADEEWTHAELISHLLEKY